MITAILVFILIVIAVALFFFGVLIGSRMAINRVLEIMFKALDESSSLTNKQRKEIADKMREVIERK